MVLLKDVPLIDTDTILEEGIELKVVGSNTGADGMRPVCFEGFEVKCSDRVMDDAISDVSSEMGTTGGNIFEDRGAEGIMAVGSFDNVIGAEGIRRVSKHA